MKCTEGIEMHEHQKMTPRRVIFNAVGLGILAWFAILLLRLLAEIAEPFLVAYTQQMLGQLLPGFKLQPWHALSDGWYGRILESIHPAIVIGVVALSALRDIWRMIKGD
jgi:hypothetical protein